MERGAIRHVQRRPGAGAGDDIRIRGKQTATRSDVGITDVGGGGATWVAASAGRQSGYFSTRDQVEKLLYDVVKHYETGGIDRPSRSPLLQPLTPTEQERIDLVAFLPRRSAA